MCSQAHREERGFQMFATENHEALSKKTQQNRQKNEEGENSRKGGASLQPSRLERPTHKGDSQEN